MFNIAKIRTLCVFSKTIKCEQTGRFIQLAVKNYSENNVLNNKCDEEITKNSSKLGFAKAYEKHSTSHIIDMVPEKNETFASLLKNSKFVDVNRLIYIMIIHNLHKYFF